MGFVSLHTHSDHSLRDGFQTIEEMLNYAAALGQTSIALTDHATMSGCGEGFRRAKDYGIKFIAGCEHYLANDLTIKDKEVQHIVLLAMNQQGYRNLNILTSKAHSSENFYFRPRLDLELLSKYNEGIICSTACLAGCHNKAKDLLSIFGDRFYIEIHTNSLQANEQHKSQKDLNYDWINLSEKLGVPFYIAQDAHYTTKTQAEAQRSWTPYSFGEGGYEQCDDYYMHSEDEIRKALDYLPQDIVDLGISNTQAVADRCTFQPTYGVNNYPRSKYKVPKDEVRRRVWQGCKHLGIDKDKTHINQIKHELMVLEKVDYFDYFLIVSDIINWCKDNNIRTGVGRGSVVGCDIAYCMGITKVDPIANGLIFERFANPERVTPADIDTDVPRGKRQEVIQHIKDEYGEVYQVVTFGKMADKSALKRAGQSLELEHTIVDGLCKQITTLDDLPAKCNDPKFLPFEYDLLKKTAKQFKGKLQNYGTHASAVVVLTSDPYDYCAVERFGENQYNLNYEFHDLEAMGLLKLDILGLETLDILDDVLSQIPNVNINLDHLPEDKQVYNNMCKGNMDGIFQLESNMMTRLIKQIEPSCLADLVHIVALGRPGCMKAGITREFIERKKLSATNGRMPTVWDVSSLDYLSSYTPNE